MKDEGFDYFAIFKFYVWGYSQVIFSHEKAPKCYKLHTDS